MKRSFVGTALILALFSFFQIAAASPAGVNSAAVREVLKLGKERTQAAIDRNIGALDKIMGNDLTYTHASGFTQTKTELVGDIKSGTIVYKSVRNSDVKVRIYGNTAVVTGHSDMVVFHGQLHHLSLTYLEVDVKRNGRWQFVAYQSTQAKP